MHSGLDWSSHCISTVSLHSYELSERSVPFHTYVDGLCTCVDTVIFDVYTPSICAGGYAHASECVSQMHPTLVMLVSCKCNVQMLSTCTTDKHRALNDATHAWSRAYIDHHALACTEGCLRGVCTDDAALCSLLTQRNTVQCLACIKS